MKHVFPQPDMVRLSEYDEAKVAQTGGLTKRELFAAMALQGLLSDSAYEGNPEEAARCAIRYTDALIGELERWVVKP